MGLSSFNMIKFHLKLEYLKTSGLIPLCTSAVNGIAERLI
jgi:hypothetical protein